MLKKYEERHQPKGLEVACMIVTEEKDDIQVETCNYHKSMGLEKVVINPSLGMKEAAELQALLEKYGELLSDMPGRTNVIECKLDCTTATPVYVKQYPLPLMLQESVEKEVDEMLRLGIIERSTSPYNAPLVVVKKPDGSNTICVDFRQLNNILVADSEPIPRVDVVFAKVGGKKVLFKARFDQGVLANTNGENI